MNRAIFLAASATSTILAGQIIAAPAFAQSQLGGESQSTVSSPPAPDHSSPSASEEQSASQASPQSGEIIVTANKRSESVSRVPLSITAASGEKLTQLGVKSASDLAKIVPGFTAVTTQSNTPVYYLRGVGFYDTSISARPTVSIYADEAPLPYSVMAMGSALDLERVEVLKGPQGTLFGSNSTGGAINFVAARPTDTFAAGADVSFGRFNDLLVSGFVSGPLAEGLKVRLAASHEGASDWQRSYTRNATNGSKNTTSGRLIIDAQPTDRLTLKFAAAGTINKSDSQTGQLVGKVPPFLPEFAAYPLAPANARATDFGAQMPLGHTLAHDDWQFQGSLRADYEITDDIKLTSLTSYVKNRQSFGQDPDATSLVINDLYIDGNLKSFNQEIRLSGTLSERAHWVLGGNYESDKTHEVINYSLTNGIQGHAFDFLGLPPTDLVPILENTSTNSKAIFGNLDYDVSEHITLHGGVRYTKYKTSFEGCSVAGGNRTYSSGIAAIFGLAPPASGSCATFLIQPDGSLITGLATDSLSQHNVSWRVGVDWKPVAGTMAYASVSRGYKIGSFSNIAAAFDNQYTPATQEELTAYEIGVKSDLIGRVLHVNAAVFHYDYKDKQVLGTIIVPVFGPLQKLVNVPKSRVNGAEFEVILQPADGFRLSAAMTYVDSKVLGSFINPTVFGPSADIGGKSFPNTPKWQLNADASYEHSVSSGLIAFVGLHLTHRSSTYGDFVQDPRLRIDGYTLLDARVGVHDEDDKWEVSLWGRNITNKYYWNTQITNSEYIVRYAGDPVTYGLAAKIRY